MLPHSLGNTALLIYAAAVVAVWLPGILDVVPLWYSVLSVVCTMACFFAGWARAEYWERIFREVP